MDSIITPPDIGQIVPLLLFYEDVFGIKQLTKADMPNKETKPKQCLKISLYNVYVINSHHWIKYIHRTRDFEGLLKSSRSNQERN